ncbi:MAG TPA: hypothetical protein VNA24_31945, partial [Hyalangium sp.]|nr:hypothetical protein [Hyalangium sp.]
MATKVSERFQPVSTSREPLQAQQSRPAAPAEPKSTAPAAARPSSFRSDGFESRANPSVNLVNAP